MPLGIAVRPSILPGAGQGLFATRDFQEGEWVSVYYGEEVGFAEVRRRSEALKSGETGETAVERRTLDYVLGGFASGN